MVNVGNDGCLIPEPLMTESSAVEVELTQLQKNLGLMMIHRSHSAIEFWKQIPKIKYPILMKINMRLISGVSTTYCWL